MTANPIIRWTLLALGLAAFGCSDGWDPPQVGGTGTLPAVLVGIGVTPHDPKVTLGEELQFIATGYYDDQTTRDVTDTVDWYTTDAGVIDVGNGLDVEGKGTTLGPGHARVGAMFFELASNEVKVEVTEAQVETLTVSPADSTLHVGETLQMQAEAAFSDGTTGNVSGTVLWFVSQLEGPESGAVAVLDANGRVEARAEGQIEVVAAYEQSEGTFESEPIYVNVVSDEVTIDGADIRILNVTPRPSGTTAQVTVTVKNSGGSPASAFWVDLFLDPADEPAPPTTGQAYEYVDLLEPGEQVELVLQMDDVALGEHQAYVLADSFGGVEEGSLGEGNNLWGPETMELTGDSGPLGPDLGITYLSAFVQADQVLYLIDVTNTGDEASGDFELGVFADPGLPPVPPAVPDESFLVSSLGPGEYVSVDLVVRATPEDFWQSWVIADSAGQLAEVNETNNTAGVTVSP